MLSSSILKLRSMRAMSAIDIFGFFRFASKSCIFAAKSRHCSVCDEQNNATHVFSMQRLSHLDVESSTHRRVPGVTTHGAVCEAALVAVAEVLLGSLLHDHHKLASRTRLHVAHRLQRFLLARYKLYVSCNVHEHFVNSALTMRCRRSYRSNSSSLSSERITDCGSTSLHLSPGQLQYTQEMKFIAKQIEIKDEQT